MQERPSQLMPPVRCQIVPLPHHQFEFLIDGERKTIWHFGLDAPRPYFFPVNGPSGISLTRMGHPGAPNHDHHRSLWFAHHDLLGIDFWSENTSARIEQSQWYSIDESDQSATIAFELVWRDGHDPAPLVKQDVFVTLRPAPGIDDTIRLPTRNDRSSDWILELQSDFHPSGQGVAFRKSNFGILALRVAKSLSVIFGAGQITGADGRLGENELFGKPNRWIDYSGPVGSTPDGQKVIEGMTLIDHRQNPGHGTDAHASWHVRDDGWIGPSISRHSDTPIEKGQALRCRYLLLVHAGSCSIPRATRLADEFDRSAPLQIQRDQRPHHQYQILRS